MVLFVQLFSTFFTIFREFWEILRDFEGYFVFTVYSVVRPIPFGISRDFSGIFRDFWDFSCLRGIMLFVQLFSAFFAIFRGFLGFFGDFMEFCGIFRIYGV